MAKFILRLIFIHSLLVLTNCIGMLGPANLCFTSEKDCENFENVIKFEITDKRYNRSTQLLDININSPFEINDYFLLELKGSIYKEGGYKPGAFYMKNSLCDTLKKFFGDIFYQVLRQTQVVEDCPIPKGEYSANDYRLDNSAFDVPQVYGKYKMEALIFNQNEELLSCFVAYYEFVPKTD